MKKEFSAPEMVKLAKAVCKHVVCNNCLGRQFAHVSTGMTNSERGRIMRSMTKSKEPAVCTVCGNIFRQLESFAQRAYAKLSSIEFSSFLVGTVLSADLLVREESLWESVGIEHCEPLKSELNREVGKLLQEMTGKAVDEKNPDIVILLNLRSGRIELDIKPVFLYGSYKKLVRGIPQTKWATYPVTVEDIIAEPLMAASGATAHAFHGAGREDIDARCLDWRPFVFELSEPKKRLLPLKKLQAEINRSRKIKVANLRSSSRQEVREVKSMRPDKTYQALVRFSKPPKKSLSALNTLVGIINQKTPSRVLHRRANLLRKRKVKKIAATKISAKKWLLKIRGEAGLYIKEFISGDNGRTTPSVADVMGPALVEKLDVVEIHLNNRRRTPMK